MMSEANQDIIKLSELISLTEEVNSKLEKLDSKRLRYIMGLMLSIIAGLTYVIISIKFKFIFQVDNDPLLLVLTSLMFCFLIGSGVYLMINLFKNREQIDSERRIMSKLYNMTTEYKRSLAPSMDIVENALLDMRLSRIFPNIKGEYEHFDFVISKENQKTLENSLIENDYIKHLLEHHELTLEQIKKAFKTSLSIEEVRLKLINHLPDYSRHHNSLSCIHDDKHKKDVLEIQKIYRGRIE